MPPQRTHFLAAARCAQLAHRGAAESAKMTFPDRERCVITRDDRRCPRVADIKGLCHYHYYQWHKRQRKIRSGTIRQANAVAQPATEWIEHGGPHSIPPPLDIAECIVASCQLPAKASRVPLCSIHHRRRERERSTKGYAEWALDADPALNTNQFWLGQLPPLVIDEMIYALAMRDRRNRKLNPSVMRLAVNGLVEYGIEVLHAILEQQPDGFTDASPDTDHQCNWWTDDLIRDMSTLLD